MFRLPDGTLQQVADPPGLRCIPKTELELSPPAAAQPPAAQPPPTQPAAAQPEAPPPLTSGDDDSDAEAGASSGLSSTAKAEMANRLMLGDPLTDTNASAYYIDLLRQRGIAALVAEVKSERPKEKDAAVWAQAAAFACSLLDTAISGPHLFTFVGAFVHTSVVPEVIDAVRRFPHSGSKLPCKAFQLLDEIISAAVQLSKDARSSAAGADRTDEEELWDRLALQLVPAVDVCLTALSSQSSGSTMCEAGFTFLADMVMHAPEAMNIFVEEGGRVVVTCLAALRTHRTAPKIVTDASLTLLRVTSVSDDLAMFAFHQNAVKLLIEATLPPASYISRRPTRPPAFHLLMAAEAVAEVYRAAFFESGDHSIALRLQEEAVSGGMIEMLVYALRGDLVKPDGVLQILQLCCAQKPAFLFRAVKAGALELGDVAGSTELGTFVNRLKMLLNDAEASADAAAAELLADEDAASARAAKAKAKRKKKPAAPLDAMPPATDAAASAGEEPPADRGSALELSQSESALRRRRRAATKAARRAAAVERARGGGAHPAESSSDGDDDEPSGAGDEPPPLPSFLADLKAPALGGPARSPAADAPPPAEVADRGSLADLFPWLAAPVSAAARATPPAIPAPAAPAPADPAAAMPLPDHAASKPARAVTPPLQPGSPAAVSDAAPAAQHNALPPPTPPTAPVAPAQPLPPLPASQMVPLERFTAQSAELARVKDELARVQDELDASKCVICLCAPRCVAVLPCRHLPLCASAECATMMGTPPLCPLCRVRVADTMQLYV